MRNVVWSILLLTLLCGVASAATLSIEPAECTLPSGDTVDMTVRVQDVSNLGGFDIDVTWDPSVVILDSGTENVTISPLFSGDVNNSAVYTQRGRIRVAAVNATLEGVSGSADLFTVRLKAVDDTGVSTPVSIKVNNFGFLNSTSGENITVSSVTNATITTRKSNEIEARIATASSQMIVGQSNLIVASVVNRKGFETSSLAINVSIIDEGGKIVFNETTPDVTIPGWGRFQRNIEWTPPDENGDETYTAIIDVTSDEPLAGKKTDTKTITAKSYTLKFSSDVYGPWDSRASAGSWFGMYAYVDASQSGNIWLNITAPDHVTVDGGRNQTRYMYAGYWNYVYVWMKTDKPGKIASGEITFDIAANKKTDSKNGPEVLIWIPSIQVSSSNITSVTAGKPGELTFNTLHTNNTYDSATKLIIQSGARGRSLSGLEYLVNYPYGCVEQTTSQMMASLNVKNYYLERPDKPSNWDWIRTRANDSVEAGLNRVLKTSDKGQNHDGGWSLWGGMPSESSSSSYAGYTLARINMPGEDLSRLLEGRVINGSKLEDEKVNFERLVRWFHENPDNPDSGTWTWSAHVCHSWAPESNTAFVMLIHDMINQTVELDDEHRGYMEGNMRNATRYLVEIEENGKWPTDADQAMARALALWGLEAFALPSDGVDSDDISDVKDSLAAWLIDYQESDGSWPAGYCYGWYDNGRKTEATAYAILALNATGIPADNKTIQGGVGWLIDQYESGGSWGYTWASQVAIDALIQCQPAETVVGTVTIKIDDDSLGSFPVNASHLRVEYPLTKDQVDKLMQKEDLPKRVLEGSKGEVRYHSLTATSGDATGPILVSIDHSQSAPINEVDGRIQDTRLIQSFGYEEDAGPLQISTDIGILSDAPLVQEITNIYDVAITSSGMVAGEKAAVTVKVRPEKGVYAPMIEIPVAGFIFDNETGITENSGSGTGAFEYLNGTTGNDHPSLFIQSVVWNADESQTYEFKITPKKHGTLDLDLRIRPLYDETNVYLFNETFAVKGRGNVSVNVIDENGMPAEAESITLGTDVVQNKKSYDFTSILSDTYPLVVNGTDGHPSIRTEARVTPDATTLCNVTLPSSLMSPTLVISEGGAGSIAGVEWVPPERPNALRNETTTYNVTVLGDGGEVGIALEFPMRYLMNEPVVRVNGVPTGDYEIINGTFKYDINNRDRHYSTTNTTLFVYNTLIGSNTLELEFKGGRLGNVISQGGEVEMWDALAILDYRVGNIGDENFEKFGVYEYPDVNRDNFIDLWDALSILDYRAGNVDHYYD